MSVIMLIVVRLDVVASLNEHLKNNLRRCFFNLGLITLNDSLSECTLSFHLSLPLSACAWQSHSLCLSCVFLLPLSFYLLCVHSHFFIVLSIKCFPLKMHTIFFSVSLTDFSSRNAHFLFTHLSLCLFVSFILPLFCVICLFHSLFLLLLSSLCCVLFLFCVQYLYFFSLSSLFCPPSLTSTHVFSIIAIIAFSLHSVLILSSTILFLFPFSLSTMSILLLYFSLSLSCSLPPSLFSISTITLQLSFAEIFCSFFSQYV